MPARPARRAGERARLSEATDGPDPVLTIELRLAPADLPALARLPIVQRAGPSRPARLLWYDDSELGLAAQGLSLMRDGAAWTLERLEPGGGHEWPACCPPPLLGRAGDPGALDPPAPFDAAPISAFDGRARAYRAGAVEIAVLHGAVRGVVETRPACRVGLTGPASALGEVIDALGALELSVPRASLARCALAAARGAAVPARHLGAPAVAGDVSVSAGLAGIVGHLLDVLLYWTDAFGRERQPEAIHQARVATRRLRSALSIYKQAACPALTEAADGAKRCAAVLGGARDWDVFLAGAGAHLAEASGGDPRVAVLLRAASRQRTAGYAALSDYLAGAEFRRFELGLGLAAALRPWERVGSPELEGPTGAFAADVLTRRLKHVRQRGRHAETMPIAALHELRKDCKRLRYAAEFFAPAFPGKPTRVFLRRLAALQEELGALNDSAASAALLAQLGRAGRGYAGGMVDGMAAATTLAARARIVERWKRFKQAGAFWSRVL